MKIFRRACCFFGLHSWVYQEDPLPLRWCAKCPRIDIYPEK